MPQPPQSSRISASKDGLQKLKNARESKRTDDGKRWSYEYIALKLSEKSYHLSKDTVERFLTGKRVYRDNASAICEFLGFKLEDVIESVTSKSKAKSTDIDWQEVCFTMLEPKRELASNLFTSGMGIKFELDDIHVPLGLVERPQKVQRRDDSSPEEGSRVYREEKEKITPIDYDDFFQQVLANQQSPKSNGKRLNIIGEPGAGKTTQLLKIADWVLDETEGLPIWISLGVVGEKPLQEYLLKDWLRDAADKLDAAPPEWVEQLEQHLKDGRVWLLLDGADEMQVADPLGKLAEFLRVPLLKNVRVVLTCRLNLWDAAGNALSEFDTYKMLDFSYGDGKNSDQVKQFIDKWFGNPSPALPYKEREQEASLRFGGTEGGQQLRKALDETGKERIKDLARHPLRLALLCFTWQSGRKKLPDTKAELYEMFVEALYELKKGIFSTTPAQRRDLNAALGRLALKAIDKRFKSILPHSLVYEELEKSYPELFELADKLGWLNKVGVEQENPLKPVYAFFHPTFQEYFAACAIPKEENWHFFLKSSDNPTEGSYRIFEPKWKEVILLWLGCQDVAKEQKEEFIQALVEFEGGFQNPYWFQAYFLAANGIAELGNCSRAKEIVAQIVQWAFGYFDTTKQAWQCFYPLDKQAKAVIRETLHSQVITELTELLHSCQDEQIRRKVAENNGKTFDERILGEVALTLLELSPGNFEASKALKKLINNSHDHFVPPFFLKNLDFSTQLEVLRQHVFLNLQYNQQSGDSSEKGGNGSPEEIIGLIDFLNTVEDGNPQQIEAMSRLWKIVTGNPEAIPPVIEVIKRSLSSNQETDRYPLFKALECLQRIGVVSPEAISVLFEVVHSDSDYGNYEIQGNAVSALIAVGTGERRVFNFLMSLVHNGADQDIRIGALRGLGAILQGDLFSSAVVNLRSYLQDFICKNNRAFYFHCYWTIWHCAENMTYPDFCQAWYCELSASPPEPDNIPVGNSPEVQTLEAQNLDFNQLKPTDYTYPLAINLLSLKEETEQGAIAQKLCNKIYKHQAVKIPGKPPTVKNDAELQQHLFEIQEKLQHPNLALVLYIKDTNGFHQPTEEAIAFCQKLADADLGIHITWIINQSLEQPLKPIQPNPPKLISKIQSWIDEIV